MEPHPDYTAIRRQLRARLRWTQAFIGQATDLPAPGAVYAWSLELELLQRLEDAQATGDRGRLQELLPSIWRIIGRAGD